MQLYIDKIAGCYKASAVGNVLGKREKYIPKAAKTREGAINNLFSLIKVDYERVVKMKYVGSSDQGHSLFRAVRI